MSRLTLHVMILGERPEQIGAAHQGVKELGASSVSGRPRLDPVAQMPHFIHDREEVVQHIPANAIHRYLPKTTTFTGYVLGAARQTGVPELRISSVFFAPGSRTFWHSHGLGQVLLIVAGQGYVATRDGRRINVSGGDIVVVPPGEVHFHGATNESLLLHEAISMGQTAWLEPVSDADFQPADS